jgi:uncharacterized protein YfaS (alpha-2-macroglobulin family)
VPGLGNDSASYASSLAVRKPVSGVEAARKAAADQARSAESKGEWGAAQAAWETRIGLGQADWHIWFSLAQAAMRRAPPDAQHALFAAWQVFDQTDQGPAQVPAMRIMADALLKMARPAQAQAVLAEAVKRAPDDAALKARLEEARRATGLLVKEVTTDGESDPARACLSFTAPPSQQEDFHPADWVKLDPAVPDAAVTRDGEQICVTGLPHGQTTAIILRQGMPGEGGLTLVKEAKVLAAIPDRPPSIAFDQRLFILPRGQKPAVTLTTVNLSSVKLTLARMTERNVVAFLRNHRLGRDEDSDYGTSSGDDASGDFGRVVWEGSAPVGGAVNNRNVHTSLPLPDALESAGPGVYALVARPGDGTPSRVYDGGATQMIVRTDLAPTVWRGADGLTVQVRGYSDVAPRGGVKLQLLSQSNDVLAETVTGEDGVGRFAAPLLHGTAGSAPRAIHAFGPGDDFAMLDLDATSFDLSDRGVAGMPQPGPLDAFIYTDRGIYRPGETVRVVALLRDNAGKPTDFPAQLTVRRPNGQVFLQVTPSRSDDASVVLPVALSPSAAVGTWTIEIRSDPDAAPVGHAEFRVDAFVPDRMAVDLGPVNGAIVAGTPFHIPLAARFLYGAPGADLSGKAHLQLSWDDAPFPALAGYRIGLAGETYAPDAQDIEIANTDDAGKSDVVVSLDHAPDTTHPLKAMITAEINDPSGHAARGRLEVKLRPSGNLIGIKPDFDGDAIDDGGDAGFGIAAVNADGSPVAMKATLRLVREIPNWRYVKSGSVARYQMVWKDEPVEKAEIAIQASGALHWSRAKLPFGRYRMEVQEAGGLAASSVRFRAGWVASDNPEVPDLVDVSADTSTHKPGESVKIHISPPFAGQATLIVASDRVHLARNIAVEAGGTDVDVPVGADWGPGAYVLVHVFHAADSAKGGMALPGRAIGLTWVGIDPSVRTIAASIDVPEKLPPRERSVIAVHASPGAYVTLAAVDEGILRLTNFANPDPASHFLGRRGLGLDIRDDWGHLIAPADGDPTLLKQGGDSGFALPDVPIRTVTLFAGPVQAGPDGVASIPLDMPDFAGQVRLMAVAWKGDTIGAAHADVLVRDPLVAEPLLPRFLSPGDDARFAVLLQNLELPPGEMKVALSTEGPISFPGAKTLAVKLDKMARATPAAMLHADGVGRGVIAMAITGPGGFAVQREIAITVRPSRGKTTTITTAELAPGAAQPLAFGGGKYLPGTVQAVARFGGPVRYDVNASIEGLYDYPFWCLEQSTSKGFPLDFVQDAALPGVDRLARVQASVARDLDLQRYDGGFGLWRANNDAQPWLSAYATEFLLRAKRSGATVPEPALKDGLKYLGEMLDNEPDKDEDWAAQAYAVYVLALADQGRPGLARVFAQNQDKLPSPLARAQVAAALSLAHDSRRAEALFRNALDFKARKFWHADYGSPLRDQMAIAVLLKESGLLPDELSKLVLGLPGPELETRYFSTQEAAWTVAAAAALGRDGKPAHISANGAESTAPVVTVKLPDSGEMVVKNLDSRPVWEMVSVSGVPVDPPPAARNQMRVKRFFYGLDGKPLDVAHLRQNSVFVLVIEGGPEDGEEHQMMIQAGLPAGWEIAGRYSEEGTAGAKWLGDLTAPDAEPAADDRYAAVLDIGTRGTFRLAVKLRAVTPGNFTLPGVEIADMYRPALFARQGAVPVSVLPAE